MSNKDQVQALISEFLTLWQEQCATRLRDSDTVGTLIQAMSQETKINKTNSSDDSLDKESRTKEVYAVFNDAFAGVFCHMVAQLTECRNGFGAGSQGNAGLESNTEGKSRET
jgi:hypothetical protein